MSAHTSFGTRTVTPSRLLKAPAVAGDATVDSGVAATVSEVLAAVHDRGDDAVREYSATFDNWSPPSFRLLPEEVERIVASVPQQVKDDVAYAQEQVRAFAEHQRATLRDLEVELQPGVHLGQRNIPVGTVGAYVPGGRYPLLASAHMTILTAKVAGVPKVIAMTPPIRGEIPANTITAMHMAGADEIYLLGGIQALAAMAYGTESIPRVELLAGPGNAYVAEAKRQLVGTVGIDVLAGPTEVVILADDSADPFVVAVDLLSQAEHGPDSPAVLITPSERLATAVLAQVEDLLPTMPTADFAGAAWRDYGAIHVVADREAMWALGDEYAAEHVQVITEQPREALDRLHSYGALFLGEETCVSYGDKVIGTNHVLPTRGAARYTGGLWVGKYLKTVTYQEVTDPAASARLGEICGRASRAERFEGHARSGDVRAAKFGGADLPWSDHSF